MNRRFLIFFFLLSASIAAVSADEQVTTRELGLSSAPLAMQSDVVLTQGEIDAAFSKIPPEHRLPFIRQGDKVELLVRNLLRNKILAEEAKKAGYDEEVLVKQRMSLSADSALANEWLVKVVKDAPEVDYETIAHEKYLAKPEVWKMDDRVDVSHILISSETRSPDTAREMATALWEELQADPSRFDAMVEESSEDPSKTVNGGRFPSVKKGDMVKEFEEVAFTMENAGEISLPVQTAYGFHIIRLNQRIAGTIAPFNEIKALAMEQVREKYLEDYRTRYLKQLLADPLVLPDGATEEMAKRYFGENLELAPDFKN